MDLTSGLQLVCAVFGHVNKLIERTEAYHFYECIRCKQTSWARLLEGKILHIGVWNRALTYEEMQILKESEPITYADILKGK